MGLLIQKKVYGNSTTQGLFVNVSPQNATIYQNMVDDYEKSSNKTEPPKVF